MTDVPRFKWTSFGPMLDEDGPFVLLVDAEAAIEQGQRDVFATHLEWTVTGMCKPDCLPCQRLNELVNEREAGYSEGKRDAIDAAVQRIKALWTEDPSWDGTNWNNALHSALVTIDTHRESDEQS